ncbi:MAG: C4-type zinc ribbon domain-containing protein [Desulfobacterales bacterium]|nr:C4-type zinc ribbon domain-containing protein [Desulfobacterales bacterium]
MTEKLKTLVDLQRVESEVASIKSKLNNVANSIEGLDARVLDREKGYQEIQTQLDVLQKQYRLLESDIQMTQTRAKKSREKLGSVKNNKEYQSILKEIEDMQLKNSIVEDQMIAILEKIETIEQAIHTKKSEIEIIKAQVDIEKKTIQQDMIRNQQILARLETDIENISRRVEPELLKKYRLVKGQTRGVAIAAVQNGVCQGCNLNIPSQMYNELQRYDTLTMCPHCQRMIYWSETE